MEYGQLATQLEATGNDRVLRRFAPAELYAPLDGVDPQPLRVAMVVDIETTGAEERTILSHRLERERPHDLLRVGGRRALRDYRTDVMALGAERAMPGRQSPPRPARVTVDAVSGRWRYTDRCRSREQRPVGTGS